MSARDYALLLIDSRELPGWRTVLRNRRQKPPADPRDLALAEQITIGVVKNLLHLQFLIEHCSGRRLGSIDPLIQKILAIGLYQLRFLDRIPAHAAVDEAVEQAKRFGQRRAAGFVNAVLRKAAHRNWPAPPDPATDPASYAELALSCPRTLFSRLTETFGAQEALRQCRHANTEPPLIVRLHAGRSVDEVGAADVVARPHGQQCDHGFWQPAPVAAMGHRGGEPRSTIAAAGGLSNRTGTPHEQTGMVVLDSFPVRLLAELAERGIGQVQDPTAASVASLLELTPGQTALDRCSGVGTKTIQLADAVGPAGLVVATDPSEPRCEILQRLANKRGLAQIHVHRISKLADLPPDEPAQFDAILVDAPCSNSGVLARRPEARYNQTVRHIGSLLRLQDEILDDSVPRLRSGGRLVYSTCSIWTEENMGRVGRILSKHPDYRMVHDQTILPHSDGDPTRYHDGGYRAVLVRG
ncbi:MAG: transcription antitermination factor NusB [Tepidisphaeraceae bacterium]|jgi:16S rRNA (cytosine967-C5)-methyltransferase